MSSIFRLPTELQLAILSYLDPYELVALKRTSKFAHNLASPSNQSVWRCAFLQLFDDPAKAWAKMGPAARAANVLVEKEWDWYQRLNSRCMALKTVTTRDDSFRQSHAHQALGVLLDIVDTAWNNRSHPLPNEKADNESPRSQSIHTLDLAFEHSRSEKLFWDSAVWESLWSLPSADGRPVTRSMSVKEYGPDSEDANRLRVYFGLTPGERKWPMARAAARKIVYNFDYANEDNDYGPFKRDGTGLVDWKVLAAITSSILSTFAAIAADRIRLPIGLEYAVPYQVEADPNCPEDWAGVSRNWIGTYAFLDHIFLQQFNFAMQHRHEDIRNAIHEAHGDLLILELELNDTLSTDPKLQTNLPSCDDLPVLYFAGRSLAPGNVPTFTLVRGTASLIPGGRHVRWRFIISYGGADQWQLEGVQPGGIRSGPIFGRWSHCDHAEEGPIGPFVYFPNDLCEFVAPR